MVEASKGYRTTFKCVSHWDVLFDHTINVGIQQYIPENHNRRLEFEFQDASGDSACPI